MIHPLIAQLRTIRKQQGLTQMALAEKMGYAQTQIGRWESGTGYPNMLSLFDWCQALGYELRLDSLSNELPALPLKETAA